MVELVERLTTASKVKIARLGLDVNGEAIDEYYHNVYSMKLLRDGMEWADAKPGRSLRSLQDVVLTGRYRQQASREVREMEALSPENHLVLMMYGDGDQFMPPLTLAQPLLTLPHSMLTLPRPFTREQQRQSERGRIHHAAFRPSHHLAIEAFKDGLSCQEMLDYTGDANLDNFKNFQARVKPRKARFAAMIQRVCDASIKTMKPKEGGAIPRIWTILLRTILSKKRRSAAVIQRACAVFIKKVDPRWKAQSKAGVIVRVYEIIMRSQRAKLARQNRAAAVIKRSCAVFIKRVEPQWKGKVLFRAYQIFMWLCRAKLAAPVIQRTCAMFIKRVEPRWKAQSKAGVIVRAYVVFMRSRRAKLAREKRAAAVIKRACADFIKRVEPQWKGKVLFRAYQIFMQLRNDTLAAQGLWTRIVRQRTP